MMSKRYHMRVRMSYYAEVEVEADSLEQAKDQALRRAPSAMARGHGSWGEEPWVVEVVELTDEGEKV